jgi:hypothetical protein
MINVRIIKLKKLVLGRSYKEGSLVDGCIADLVSGFYRVLFLFFLYLPNLYVGGKILLL